MGAVGVVFLKLSVRLYPESPCGVAARYRLTFRVPFCATWISLSAVVLFDSVNLGLAEVGTLITCDVVLVPNVFDTVRVTVKVPPLVYEWVGF